MFFRQLLLPTLLMQMNVTASFFKSVKEYIEVASRYSCGTYERCNQPCISHNFTGLYSELRKSVHGQPLVSGIVMRAITAHFRTTTPKRALALSFHGPTGVGKSTSFFFFFEFVREWTGKSFVSQLITKHLYRLGMKSEFVHYFVASRDFPHSEHTFINHYKDIINREIKRRLSRCPYGLFIFDEIDKMPVHLIDIMASYLDFNSNELRLHSQNREQIDFTKSIFIFLSNSGERAITNFSLNAWRQGIDRNAFSYKHLERILTNAVFNEEGGLFHTELIERDMISFLIPFLPLEREHLKECALDYMRERNYTSLLTDHNELMEFVMAVIDEIVFVPDKLQLFSSSGCKRVFQRVEYLIMDVENRLMSKKELVPNWKHNKNEL